MNSPLKHFWDVFVGFLLYLEFIIFDKIIILVLYYLYKTNNECFHSCSSKNIFIH
jgi:hypothetical protein